MRGQILKVINEKFMKNYPLGLLLQVKTGIFSGKHIARTFVDFRAKWGRSFARVKFDGELESGFGSVGSDGFNELQARTHISSLVLQLEIADSRGKSGSRFRFYAKFWVIEGFSRSNLIYVGCQTLSSLINHDTALIFICSLYFCHRQRNPCVWPLHLFNPYDSTCFISHHAGMALRFLIAACAANGHFPRCCNFQ